MRRKRERGASRAMGKAKINAYFFGNRSARYCSARTRIARIFRLAWWQHVIQMSRYRRKIWIEPFFKIGEMNNVARKYRRGLLRRERSALPL